MRERGKGVTLILLGFARHPFRRFGRMQHLAWSFEILMGMAIWVFASLASAQATPGPSRIQERKEKPPVVVAPAQQPAHPVVPVYGAAAPEQTLPQPPEIAWDGKQLTIDAENSKLSDILLAIRAKTGASVDFPGGATSERVAVHLGPAPVREVLSSLLYGTDFDYVIQSTDDDEDGLRSVVVTLRGGKGDDLVGADAEQVAADAAKTRGMRLMPGWAAPGKPAFQAEAEAALAAKKEAEAESAVTAESAAATDSDVPTRGEGAAASSSESAAAGPSPTNTDPKSVPAATSSADGSTVSVSDIPPPSTAAASSSSDSSGEQSEASQKVQNMLNMFEQRRQIQAQQNQRAAPTTTN